MKRKIALIAFGGNALLPDNDHDQQEDQQKNAQKAAELMVHVVKKGYEIILVHGNGPQIGNLLIQMDAASGKVPPYTLDVGDAMTEGSMGYMLEKALINELRRNSLDKEVASIMSQVIVDRDDPAFQKPTKPVGPFYTRERALALQNDKKWTMIEDAGRGWRRVLPSPKPIDVVPKGIIRDLVQAGRIVIAVGGGGVPVIIDGNGLFRGVEAVIDKDYAAGLLAREVKVDLFVILTTIERVFIDYGKPNQKEAPVLTVAEARKHLEDGQFPPGSMGPKIRAAIEYIEAGGEQVLITTASHLKAALINRSGTRIIAAALGGHDA